MSHKRHYTITINGEQYDAYGDGLPIGVHTAEIAVRQRKRAQRKVGPNYDPHDPNSIEAALLYARVHETCLTLVWQYLFDHQGQWVRGTDLRPYGDAWRVRISELTDKFGWPIERRSPDGPGVWWYRMPVLPTSITTNGQRPDPTVPSRRVRLVYTGSPESDVPVADVPVPPVRWVYA